MRLINSKAEYIPQDNSLEGIYKQVELAGRTCYKSEQKYIDHADIVVTHECKNHCPFCVDKFINTSRAVVSIEAVEKFLSTIKSHSKPNTEVLLLGGEPTMASIANLSGITDIIREYGFSPIISTNNPNKDLIISLLPYFDWIQYTIRSWQDIKFFLPYKDRINIKLAGDKKLTLEKLEEFIELTKDYPRKSISMYFTPSHEELCTDPRVWSILDSLDWTKNGSYLYTFYKGVRIKRCIKGVTNLVEEPSVPKLYPNGNYNKTWANEDQDGYLDKSPSLSFVERMIKSNHTAMLEHGTVYLKFEDLADNNVVRYIDNPYSAVGKELCVTSNLRVLQEHNWLDDLQYLCSPTEFHEKRYTMRFTCSRAIANELVRSRTMSFAQESQRYINYSKERHGGEITYIIPSWINVPEGIYDLNIRDICNNKIEKSYYSALYESEIVYKHILREGYTPQQARDVLPNATKTELIMTGFASDWRFLMDIRLFEKTGAVHPDMKDLMQKTQKVMQEAGIWEDIMSKPSRF